MTRPLLLLLILTGLISCNTKPDEKPVGWPQIITSTLLDSASYSGNESAMWNFPVIYIGAQIDTIVIESQPQFDTLRVMDIPEPLHSEAPRVTGQGNTMIVSVVAKTRSKNLTGHILSSHSTANKTWEADSLFLFADTSQVFVYNGILKSWNIGDKWWLPVSNSYPVFITNHSADTLLLNEGMNLSLEIQRSDGRWVPLLTNESTCAMGENKYTCAPGETIVCSVPATTGTHLYKARIVYNGRNSFASNSFHIQTNFQ
jgi:hypothetical protein